MMNLLTLLVFAAGMLLYAQLNRELFPYFSRQTVRIATTYPGASPEEVEELITAKIEEEVSEIDELVKLTSLSQEGRSKVVMRFQPETDMNRALSDVRAALDRVHDLPDEAEEPQVNEVKSAFPVITVSVAGNVDQTVLREVARDIRDEIRRITGVAAVRALGIRDKQILVEINPEKLDHYRLSLDELRAAIGQRNFNEPAGKVKTARGEIFLRIRGQADGMREVERIIVRAKDSGHALTVGDVANVHESFEDARIVGRFEGKPAINLIVSKEIDGDAVYIAERVRDVVGDAREEIPATVTVEVFNDFSWYINNRLKTLAYSGLIGLAIVLVTLWFFVRTRVALLTALGIPFSLLGSVILMALFGMSLNMISVFGLILVLGLLVDDAVIVSENVYRYVEDGLESTQAAIKGTSEVGWPVAATVVTTVAAFVPLLLLPGIVSAFLRPIPLVVSFALLSSLLEVLLVLPAHLADSVTRPYARRVQRQERTWLTKSRKAYERLLALVVHWRYVTVVFLLGISVVLGTVAYYRIPLVLFHEFESSQFFVNFETTTGSKLEDTVEIARQTEDLLMSLPPGELKSVATSVGIAFEDVHREQHAPNVAHLAVELEEERTRNANDIIAELRAGMERIPSITKIQFLKVQGGPGGPAIEARVIGDDLGIIRRLAKEVKGFLAMIPGVRDIRDDLIEGKQEIRIKPIAEARALGLDVQEISRQLQHGFMGVEASEIQRSDEQVPIVIRFPEADRRSLETVLAMKVTLPSGERVLLRDVAAIETGMGPLRVTRYGEKRSVAVLADVDPDKANVVEVTDALKRRFGNLPNQFHGSRVVVEGERQELEESIAALPEISLMALFLIYFILGCLFKSFTQPFVVMAVIPLSMNGVVIGHLIMGEPLSFLSLMGLVALAGVVVNDSLILVDFINRGRSNGMARVESILKSGVLRLRPVLLTTVTTVGGLVPLAFFAVGQARFLSPMAISVVWGLSFATVLTLILIPCLYAITDDLGRILKKLGAGFRSAT